MEKETRFNGKTADYARHRPAYPEECLDFLAERGGLNPETVVADIGAGTGIFSAQLLERCAQVIAVEPNDEMREKARTMLGFQERLTLLGGSAEATGIADGCVNLVTAAQSFHWFDTERFADECGRILKPGGRVALIWNSRDMKSPIVRETYDICKRLCPDFKGFSGGVEERPEVFQKFFRDGACEYREFAYPVEYDCEGLVGRYCSASFAPKQGEPAREVYIEAFRELFDRHSVKGKLVFPYRTRCYLGAV